MHKTILLGGTWSTTDVCLAIIQSVLAIQMVSWNTRHFRLIFKRSQSTGPKPLFSLLVSAEMTPDFIQAARHYGVWNDIVYADPKLQEAREMQARQSELRAREDRRRSKPMLKDVDLSNAALVIPAYLTIKILKVIYILPFKLIWWIFAALRIQKTQIMRLRELQLGKVITTRTFNEIIEAEQMVQESAETIEAHIRGALDYGGEAYEAKPSG